MKPNEIDPDQKRRTAEAIDVWLNHLAAKLPQLGGALLDAQLGEALLNLASAKIYAEYAVMFRRMSRKREMDAVRVLAERGLLPMKTKSRKGRQRV